ncbi:hypothetical protein BK010_02380 [Tenericutes bacterium MO-XQ]|nr:hypothetical protein BK010_02380 [Tenericutes bacterium MO-XQ]
MGKLINKIYDFLENKTVLKFTIGFCVFTFMISIFLIASYIQEGAKVFDWLKAILGLVISPIIYYLTSKDLDKAIIEKHQSK